MSIISRVLSHEYPCAKPSSETMIASFTEAYMRHSTSFIYPPPPPPTKWPPLCQTTIPNAFFLNENDIIPVYILLKFVPRSPIDNRPALIQIMAWHRTGYKPLFELMLTQVTDAYMRHSASLLSDGNYHVTTIVVTNSYFVGSFPHNLDEKLYISTKMIYD